MQHERMVGFEIASLSNLMRRQVPQHVKEKCMEGLTHRQRRIIGFIGRQGTRDVFQKDLEAELNIRRSTASGMLRLLEEGGFIIREPVEFDARLKRLVLTEKARQRLDSTLAEIRSMERLLVAGLSEKELGEFFRTLEKMKANLKQADAGRTENA